MKLLILLAVLVLTACQEGPRVVESTVDAGSFISSTRIDNWEDAFVMSKVLTSKGEFTVKGFASALKGEAVELRIYSDGDRYLCFENSHKCKYTY